MTSFLFASVSATGHVSPMVALAREAAARGHDVAFYTGDQHAERLAAVGVRHLPLVDAVDADFDMTMADEWPDRPKSGPRQLRYDVKQVFVSRVPGQATDLERHLAATGADVLVAETGMAMAAAIASERTGVPYVAVSITPLATPSIDTAPFGTGLKPSSSPLGRVRNRVLERLTDRLLFGPAMDELNAIRARLGLPSAGRSLLRAAHSPDLNFQASVAAFEYERSDLPRTVRFIGPLLPPPPPGAELPAWIADLDPAKPIVLVTQGTVAKDPTQLIGPALEALRDEPVHVIATTAGADTSALGPVPANAHVVDFVAFGPLMPRVAALVTNGGYGGVHFGLTHGVPVVVVGRTEDKAEVVGRVNWTGVGVGIAKVTAKPAQLRRAVRRVLDDPAIAERARSMQAEMARHDGPATGVDLLEELAARKAAGRQPASLAA